MRQIQLRAVAEPTEIYEQIEKAIVRTFLEELYHPILRELGFAQTTLQNASDDLLTALQKGRITFSRGTFSGKFSAAISKELKEMGAKWDRASGTWRLLAADLPYEIRIAVSVSSVMFERKMSAVDKMLAAIIPEDIAAKIKTAALFDKALFKTDKDVAQTLEAITVKFMGGFSDAMRKRFGIEYQKNLDLSITEFTKAEVIKLRKTLIEKVYTQGNRYDVAAAIIKKSFKTTEKKAEFLASQETRLAVAKLKEIRYQDAGVNYYKWKCVTGTTDHPVRPIHRALNNRSEAGELFRFDDPPITSPTGARNNPGEDFRCRCVALPVFK